MKRRTITSYAQNCEDIIIYHALRNEQKVFWIDVGANDPVYDSVTKILSDMGGHGINIEPQAVYYDKLRDIRPRDINLQLGVSNKTGELMLYGGGTTASFERENGLKHNKDCYKVDVKTLTSICEINICENQAIHFLKIDVEGWERNVLEGMDFTKYRPWILCIEACRPGTEELDYSSWESLLLQNNYHYVRTVGLNRWYVAKEKKEIADRILGIRQLKGFYRIKKYDKEKNLLKKTAVRIYWLDFMKPVRNTWRRIKQRVK